MMYITLPARNLYSTISISKVIHNGDNEINRKVPYCTLRNIEEHIERSKQVTDFTTL